MMKRARKSLLVTGMEPQSIVVEAYRSIRMAVKFSGLEQGMKTLFVTSTAGGEGKSSVSANLGIVMAQDRNRVLLVDCHFRRPHLHYLFRVRNLAGLSAFLAKSADLEDVILTTGIDNLSLIPSGPANPHSSEWLGSERMDALLKQARERFDVIILDGPPMLYADAYLLARIADGIMLVFRPGHAKKERAMKVQKLLYPFHEKVLGVILNDSREERS